MTTDKETDSRAFQWFDKFAGLLFLLLIVSVILFLGYNELPEASEQAAMILIGVLSSTFVQAVQKLFGDSKSEELREDFHRLEIEHEELRTNYETLTKLLVDKAFPA